MGGRRRRGLRARACTTWSGATPRSTVRRCHGSGSRTSRRSRTSTASRPRGRSATPTWSPSTARRSGCTPCTAAPARTPPSRGAARPFPYAALPHEPYVAALVERLRAAGVSPASTAMGVDLRPGGEVRAVRDVRRLPVPARRQVGCRGVRGRPRAGDRVGSVGHRGAGGAAGHRRLGATGRGGGRGRAERAGHGARATVRGVGGSGELGGAAAGVGESRSTRTGWATRRAGSAGAS